MNNEMPDLNSLHQDYEKLTNSLIEKKLTITTMESCTSGFISSLITDTQGSSAIIKGAFVTYSNEAKIKCGVPADVIQKFGVYSKETALAMAKAAKNFYKSDIGVGITGTFGNVDENNADSVPGVVYISVVNHFEAKTQKIILPQNITRFQSKLCVAKELLNML